VENIVGQKHSRIICEATSLKLSAADHDHILNDGSGLSGKVHAGAKEISVHFRYHFDGKSRAMPLGAWPRVALDFISLRFAVGMLAAGTSAQRAVFAAGTLDHGTNTNLQAE
jgi:hypothetical protein